MNHSGVSVGPRAEFDPPLTVCPLCASERITEFATDHRGVKISRCKSCSLFFMNPQYTSECLSEYYSHYTGHDPVQLQSGYVGIRAKRKRLNLALLTRFVRHGGKILSIGCGDGLELVLAREMGFEVEAYDVDVEAAKAVEIATGVRVFTGDLFASGLRRESYDCVILDQVLEHPKNPGAYLGLIRDLLTADGVCYIGVPNIGSLSNRWKTVRDRIGLRPPSRMGRHYDTWHHLHYYQPRCFQSALARLYGLDVLSIVGDPDPDCNPVIYRLRRMFPVIESSMIVIAKKSRS